MKDFLISAPILKYPDTSKPYTIFTDASKYGWAGVPTQEHTSVIDGKEVTKNHPVSFVSGMFYGSQLNWAAMTKEAYAIYMTVKKSTFYLTGQEITLRSDHLPLNTFLNHKTLNNTVDNWAVEIESFKVKFVYISGKDNILADTLSRLIDIDPDVVQDPKLKDYEFECYAFETLPKTKSTPVGEMLASVDGVDICEINISYDNAENSQFSVKLPLTDTQFLCLQEKDPKIRALHEKVYGGMYKDFYLVYFYNGYQRTYAAIKHSYYWKGMRKHILVHCKTCVTSAKQRVQKTQFEKQIFEPGVQPMEFICIDLIGEFHPPTSKGNSYTLTAVCMLTGFTFCIPIKNKSAEEVVTAWRNHISFPFGLCRKLLTDNGTEFKNDLFNNVAEQLGVERKIYTPPYRPQSNGHIEGFHNFLKACLCKHISRNKEWDDITPLATASYNWLPNQHSRESPFFIMFGRDALTNLQHLIKPKLRYMGTSELILDLKLMSNIYQVQIHNLKMARQWVIEDQKPVRNPNINTGDLVLVKDYTSKTFMPKYKAEFCVIRVLGNKVEVKDNSGKMSWYQISNVKKTDMVTELICQLPDYNAFGRLGRLSFDPE